MLSVKKEMPKPKVKREPTIRHLPLFGATVENCELDFMWPA